MYLRKYLKSLFFLVFFFFCGFGLFYLTKHSIEIKTKEIIFNHISHLARNYAARYPHKIGYVIKDLNTKIEVKYNENKVFSSASLVKVPIMACAFEAVKDRYLKLEDEYELKREHKVGGSGVLKFKPVGTTYTLEKLIRLMIRESDNTATNIITEILGLDYINHCFNSFGLKITDFKRNIMKLKLRKKDIENYTTPSEMAYLLEKIYRKNLVNRQFSKKMLELLKIPKPYSHRRIAKLIPPYIEIANKTGTLKNAFHDVGIIFTPKGDILICILTSLEPKVGQKLISNMSYAIYCAYVKS